LRRVEEAKVVEVVEALEERQGRCIRDPDACLDPDELWKRLIDHVSKYYVLFDFPVVAKTPEERDFHIAAYCTELLHLLKLYVFARYKDTPARHVDVVAIAYETRSHKLWQMLQDENMRRYVGIRIRLSHYVVNVLNRCLAELLSMDIIYARGTLLKDFVNAFQTWIGPDYISGTSLDSIVKSLMVLEWRSRVLTRRIERAARARAVAVASV